MSDDKVNGLLTGSMDFNDLVGFYNLMIKEGCDREEAMMFCDMYLTSVVTQSGGIGNGKADEPGNH